MNSNNLFILLCVAVTVIGPYFGWSLTANLEERKRRLARTAILAAFLGPAILVGHGFGVLPVWMGLVFSAWVGAGVNAVFAVCSFLVDWFLFFAAGALIDKANKRFGLRNWLQRPYVGLTSGTLAGYVVMRLLIFLVLLLMGFARLGHEAILSQTIGLIPLVAGAAVAGYISPSLWPLAGILLLVLSWVVGLALHPSQFVEVLKIQGFDARMFLGLPAALVGGWMGSRLSGPKTNAALTKVAVMFVLVAIGTTESHACGSMRGHETELFLMLGGVLVVVVALLSFLLWLFYNLVRAGIRRYRAAAAEKEFSGK